jgi:two-component system chemotaxis sensor kinase CheA
VNQPEYFHIFLAETQEHLLTMQRWLSVLVDHPEDQEALLCLFRSVHSIKGMAASMGFKGLSVVAHGMEDGLDRLRRSGRLPAEAVEHLYRGLALLEARLADIAAGNTENQEGAGDGDSRERVHILRISMPEGNVALWMLLVNELMRFGTLQSCRPEPEEIAEGTLPTVLEVDLLCRFDIEDIEQRCRRVCNLVVVEKITRADAEPGLAMQHGVGQATVRVSTNLLDRFVGLSGELLSVRHRLQESLQQGHQEGIEGSCLQLDRLLADLRHQVLDARMVPLEAVTASLPRLVKDLCRSTGKAIRLNLVGNEVRLDRAILEAMSEPLMHMVRNAVDHGIEENGTITIAARRDRDRVTLDVIDDGRGLDAQCLVERARQDGFLEVGQGAHLSGAELLQLICRPGFTTARCITETSGRGIGMDVVRHTSTSSAERFKFSLARDRGPASALFCRLRYPLCRYCWWKPAVKQWPCPSCGSSKPWMCRGSSCAVLVTAMRLTWATASCPWFFYPDTWAIPLLPGTAHPPLSASCGAAMPVWWLMPLPVRKKCLSNPWNFP